MSKLSINKQNQAQLTIPADIVDVLGWKNGDTLLISKVPGKKHIVIENMSKREIYN